MGHGSACLFEEQMAKENFADGGGDHTPQDRSVSVKQRAKHGFYRANERP